MMKRFPRPCAIALLVIAGCSAGKEVVRGGLDPPPVQAAELIKGMPLDAAVQRDAATPLESVQLVELPRDETDTGATQLLGDGTFYRLELDRLGKAGAVLVRFDNVADGSPVATRIPLIPPPGQKLRDEPEFNLGLRVATSTEGVRIDRNRRGSVWWEEDGPKGRLIEFLIDGDRATMAPPGPPLDDPNAPVAHRFNRTPDREVSFRLTTGAVDGPDVPTAVLGGSGFSIALARTGSERTEALVESPAFDLPHVDVSEPAPGLLRVTIGYITGDSGHATQVTYDSKNRRWQDHRPLVDFPEAQGVEVADVGPAGTLVVLGLHGPRHDPETGLYWTRPGRPVRHLLQRVRELKTATVPDGFVAIFQDDFKTDVSPDDQNDVLVLRAKGDRLALHMFTKPGRCSSDRFTWLGGTRFAATFCSTELIVFDVPDIQ